MSVNESIRMIYTTRGYLTIVSKKFPYGVCRFTQIIMLR